MTVRIRPADASSIRDAADLLRRGKLVVFPTETVYGLGADAMEARAVGDIFSAKGRPADNPCIVHVADIEAAKSLVFWNAKAQRLADKFWPGPLTIVLPRRAAVPNVVTGGLDSVAIRIPVHPVAQALLKAAEVPIAAPSANKSGSPSPTLVAHAAADLGEKVSLYLDGGHTQFGVESTVVSVLGARPVILRPGGVTREAIEAIVGPLDVVPSAGPARSPGMKYRHYAPKAKLVLASPESIAGLAEKMRQGTKLAIIASSESGLVGPEVRVPGSRNDAKAWAHQIFELLRALDAEGFATIVVEEIPEAGLGAAVMNRLRKAVEG